MTAWPCTHRGDSRLARLLALSLAALAADVFAEPVDIAWDSNGRFAHSVAIGPGKFAELCTRLSKGQSVRWTFLAEQPLSFNVHYHVGKDVIYAARDERVREQNGYLEVADDQDYCWMWTNDGKAPVSLTTTIERG